MRRLVAFIVTFALSASFAVASSQPIRGRNGMVASQKMLASAAAAATADMFTTNGEYDWDLHHARNRRAKGHAIEFVEALGCAQVILFERETGLLEGGSDLRRRDGGVAAY